MRKMLFVLVPWMAATIASANGSQPAAVVFTHQGIFSDRVERVGEECFIPSSLAENWGWKVDLHRREADIDADGRHLRVTLGPGHKLPLSECLNQLGATYEWGSNNTLSVYGQIRSIELVDGHIRITSTLGVSATGFKVGDPERLAIDITGARLSPTLKEQPNGPFRFKQMTSNIVRIVMEGKGTSLNSFPATVARDFDIPVPGGEPESQPGNPITLPPKHEPRVISTQPSTQSTAPSTQAPVTPANLVSMEATDKGEDRLTLQFALDKAPSGRATARYTSPTTIELTIPGTKGPDEPLQRIGHPFVAGLKVDSDPASYNLKVTLDLNRAVTMRFSATGNTITLRLSPARHGGILNGVVIAVDAGHGGKDTGTQSIDRKISEKDLTLAISRVLVDKLEKQGATVIEIRPDDRYPTLPERSAMANLNGAKVFLSIHINSVEYNRSISGTMCFYHHGSEKGKALASAISEQFKQTGLMKEWGARDDFARFPRVGMAVLRNSKMPGTLLELGFLSNDKDKELLQSEDFRDSITDAIVRGLMNYCGDEQNLEANP